MMMMMMTHYQLLCFNGNKSCLLIRDMRGVNARLLLMFVTRPRLGKCDEVIKYSVPIFSSFSQYLLQFMRKLQSNMILSFINIRYEPREG